MKPREPRRKVLIDARLRHEAGWGDALILNLSRRGMMARVAQAPRRGAYIEVCRGNYRVVARVIWVRDNAFGALAQDAISLAELAAGQDSACRPDANCNDRRSRPRGPAAEQRSDRSRQWSQRLQFIAVTAFAAAAAAFAFDAVSDSLSRPLALVEGRLGGG